MVGSPYRSAPPREEPDDPPSRPYTECAGPVRVVILCLWVTSIVRTAARPVGTQVGGARSGQMLFTPEALHRRMNDGTRAMNAVLAESVPRPTHRAFDDAVHGWITSIVRPPCSKRSVSSSLHVGLADGERRTPSP